MKSFSLLQQLACLAIVMLFASSCEIETQKDKYEERVLGTWEFSEVTKLKLFDNQNVTEDYEETLFEFLSDGKVNVLDKDALTVLATGTWDMDEEYETNGEQSSTYVSLETRFDDSLNGVDYSFDESTITRLKNGELCFKENNFSKNKRVEMKRF
jgi:hypothetical protein